MIENTEIEAADESNEEEKEEPEDLLQKLMDEEAKSFEEDKNNG